MLHHISPSSCGRTWRRQNSVKKCSFTDLTIIFFAIKINLQVAINFAPENMALLTLTLFGDVRLNRDGTGDIVLPRKTQLLLAYLAFDGGRAVARDKLASLIWPDRGEEQARHSLRQCLFTLAKAVGEGGGTLLEADRQQISLNPDHVDVDTWRFERLLVEDTPETMQEAVAVHVDDFVAGVSFDDETLDSWCAAERTRLRELCYETLARLSSYYTDTARLDDAIEAARLLVTLDPLREDGHRTLIRLYSRSGRRAEALKQYQRCVEILKRELNIEPDAATTRLYTEMKTGKEPAAGAAESTEPRSETPIEPIEGGEPAPAPPNPPIDRKRVALASGLVLFIVLAIVMSVLELG